jgi:hypothetical protein
MVDALRSQARAQEVTDNQKRYLEVVA